MSRRNVVALTVLAVSFAAIAAFAATNGEKLIGAIEEISLVTMVLLIILHSLYVLVNAELWFQTMREAEPAIARRSIYLSFFMSSFLFPFSAVLGLAGQVAALKRLDPEVRVGHAVASLAPMTWVKALVAAVIIAILAMTMNGSVLVMIAIVLALAATGGLMFWVESRATQEGALHGLAVIRKPLALARMSSLVVVSIVLQVVKLALVLAAIGVSLDMVGLFASIVAQGLAGALPLLAGPISAAVAFSGQAADAASASLAVSAAAVLTTLLLSSLTLIYAQSRAAVDDGEMVPVAEQDR